MDLKSTPPEANGISLSDLAGRNADETVYNIRSVHLKMCPEDDKLNFYLKGVLLRFDRDAVRQCIHDMTDYLYGKPVRASCRVGYISPISREGTVSSELRKLLSGDKLSSGRIDHGIEEENT